MSTMSEHVHPNAGAPLTNAQADDQRHPLLADDDNPSVAEYPRLFNRSARFIFRAVPRAERPITSEYVGVDRSRLRSRESRLAVSQWNMLWEAAQFRRYIALDPGLPESLQRLVDRENTNVVLVPRSESRYWEYAPLLHLLPAPELHRFGLPVLASPTGRF